MKDWQPNLDLDDKDLGRNNDININDNSPLGDLQTGEQGNEDANMTGAPDSQTKSNDNNIAHQLAGQEFCMEEYPQINNTIGYNTYNPKGNTLDNDDRLDYLHSSWYRVATPLPSPPLPPPKHESGLSEPNNDGFQNVDAKDYWEYKQWYAEDNIYEDSEMLAKTLTNEEVDSIIMLAIQQFGSVTQNNYEQI
ncbi:hypothetical protein RhiTH_004378 [Rhizoctonia solani]